ncbi:MAG: transposase [Thaumarchaeota archaeon]|nr:transposase [Nitrososphaerota archaeon]
MPVCAATVTPGDASDSPYPRLMVETLPEGDGDVLADAAYGGIKNCNAIRDSDQRAIIDSKSNAIIKFKARAAMLRFREAHPGTFHRMLRLRNNTESAFSSMKARFGGVVRALRQNTQPVELPSMCICYHMSI